MTTMEKILEELKDVPADRLEDVYSFIRELIERPKQLNTNREEILSFVGCFADMPQDDFADFINEIRRH